MTLVVEKGTFTKTTSTSTPVNQTVTLNDSGLTPKAVILWSNGLTSTNTFAENYEFTYGFSDGTNDVCQRSTVEDNDTACVASYSFNNNCIISMCDTTTPTAGTETSRGDLLSFGAGNFHINWSTQSDTNAKVIHYIVIGGTDITNVSAFTSTVGDTLTGNHSWNGSGTTFTPDFALTMTGADAYVTLNSLEVTNAREQICLGAVKDATHEFCLSVRSEDGAANADTDMNFHNNASLLTIENAAGAENFLADFVSFNSAAGGGITCNVSNAAGLSTQIVAFLLIKGGNWDVGTFQQRSGTGTQDVTLTSDHFNPAIVALAGVNTATANSTVADNYLCIGASDGTREGCAWCGDQNAGGLMVNTRKNLTTEKIYTQCTPNATAGSSTTNSEANMNDMATLGKFQLNWSTASATLGQIGYWTVGTLDALNITKTMSTETVTVSDSIARLLAATRAPATETVSASESIARLYAATRPMGGQSIVLDGINQDIDCTNDATLWSQALSKFSFSFWVYPTLMTDGNVRRIVSHGAGVAQGFVCHIHQTVANQIIFEIAPAGGGASQAKANTLTQGEWNHIVCVYDNSLGTQNLKIYRNNVVGATTANLTESPNKSSTLALGVTTSNQTLKGNIKDFRWWTTKALDTTEITNIYNNSPAAPTPDYWQKLEEGTGNPVDEISGTKVGTLTNGAAWQAFSPPVWAEKYDISDSLAYVYTPAPAGTNYERALATETITISEVSLVRMLAANRTLGTETVSASESIARMLAANRALSTETVTSGETLDRIRGVNRTLTTETVATSESIARMLVANRALPETVASSENLARMLVANRSLSTENTAVSDSLQQLKTIVRALATETVTVGESLNRMIAATRALPETVSSGESLTRLLAANRALTTETTTIGESLNRIRGINRALATETVTSSESLTRLLAANRALSTETVTVGETLARMLTAFRILSTETISLSESLTKVYTPGGGGPTAYERALSDTVVIGEALARMLAANRALSTEVTAISESLARSRGVNRALTENVTIASGTLNRLLTAIRALPETTAMTEQLNRMLAASRTLATESVTVGGGTLARVKGVVRAFTENVTSSESLSRLMASTRAIVETTTLIDSLTRLAALSRSLSDTTVISDSLVKLRTVIKTLVETVNITESLNRVFTGSRELIETIGVIDTLTKTFTFFSVPTMLKKLKDWIIGKYGASGVDPTL